MIIIAYEFNTTDAYDLARRLNAETREKGDELTFKYCPFCHGGQHNDKYTFSVSLRTGQYNCLRGTCGEHGGFVSLAKAFNFPLDFGTQAPMKKEYKRLPQKKITDIVVRDTAIEYMKSRGISEDTVRKFGITSQKDNPDILSIPFFDWNGELTFIKYRNTKYQKGQNGSKEWCEKGSKPILYGIPFVDYSNKTLVITEGQIDSLSLYEAGVPNAVSVPMGKNNYDWINLCWDFLCEFNEIIVFGDHENGEITLADELNRRLKKHIIKVVKTDDYKGLKDANDIFRTYGADTLKTAVSNAAPVPVNHIVSLADIKAVSVGDIPHFKSGIAELDGVIGGLFESQYILLTGKRGEGKSTFMSQLVCEAIDQGINTLVYSGELPNTMFKNWLDIQLAGRQHLLKRTLDTGKEYYEVPLGIQNCINNWYRDRIFVVDNSEFQDGEDLFDILEAAIYRYGIRFVCIDNLMTVVDCDGKSDYYLSQTATVNKVKALTKRTGCTVLMVAHERKQAASDTNDQVSGTANITNLADVVIAYRRNKTGGEYDAEIEISKNRTFTGLCLTSADKSIGVYFDPVSRRLKTDLSPKNWEKAFSWEKDWEREIAQINTDEDLPF